jgi:peptidoglycan/xylan/chitin deacetylase (PgdA/CDA1 family)
MNENDLKELDRLKMEVGAHAHHHIKMKKITNKEDLKFEVLESKRILESVTGKPVWSFAYPFGSIPKGYKELLAKAGYAFACGIYLPFEHRFALRRFIYHDGDTESTLHGKLSWQYKCYRILTDPLKKY